MLLDASMDPAIAGDMKNSPGRPLEPGRNALTAGSHP